jgi:hypothetical protein
VWWGGRVKEVRRASWVLIRWRWVDDRLRHSDATNIDDALRVSSRGHMMAPSMSSMRHRINLLLSMK